VLFRSAQLAVSGAAGENVKFNLTGGTVAVGTGAKMTVASGAKVELAGTVSALKDSSAARYVDVTNSSTTANGLYVSGTNQALGILAGTGKTTVGDGTNAADLTATSILQDTLVINANGTVAIRPTTAGDAGAVAGGSVDSGSLASVDLSLPVAAQGTAVPQASGGAALPAAAGASQVPEPATLVLLAIGGLCLGGYVCRRRARAARP
jgi:hypothetical protein